MFSQISYPQDHTQERHGDPNNELTGHSRAASSTPALPLNFPPRPFSRPCFSICNFPSKRVEILFLHTHTCTHTTYGVKTWSEKRALLFFNLQITLSRNKNYYFLSSFFQRVFNCSCVFVSTLFLREAEKLSSMHLEFCFIH